MFLFRITKPIEDKTEDTETPDPVTDSSITQAFTDDLLPREKTFRSQSTVHTRCNSIRITLLTRA